MNENLVKVLYFVGGLTIGAVGTFAALKKKYDIMYQESVESVKESLRDQNIASGSSEEINEQESSVNPMQVGTTPSELLRTNYNQIVKDAGYNKQSEKEEIKPKKDLDSPRVITSEEFEDNVEYNSYICHYFSDGVITDDNYDKLEDLETTVGTDFQNHFGSGDMPDVVYVRNDERGCDYEILQDERSYEDDVLPTLPPMEE